MLHSAAALAPSTCIGFSNLKQPIYINVQRFRGGLVSKAHRLLYQSTLGLRVITKERKNWVSCIVSQVPVLRSSVPGFG